METSPTNHQLNQELKYQRNGDYHWELKPGTTSLFRYTKALSMLPTNLENLRCLDYGGGDGVMAHFLAQRGAHVTLIDLSHRALSHALVHDRRIDAVTAIDPNVIKPDSFDYITMLEVLEHIPTSAELPTISGLKDVLKPGGNLILSVPSSNISLDLQPCHERHYEVQELIDKIAMAGLIVRKLSPYGFKEISKIPHPVVRDGVKRAVFSIDWLQRKKFGSGIAEYTSDKHASGIFLQATKPIV